MVDEPWCERSIDSKCILAANEIGFDDDQNMYGEGCA